MNLEVAAKLFHSKMDIMILAKDLMSAHCAVKEDLMHWYIAFASTEVAAVDVACQQQ
jgi:hypothetical protein